MAKKTAKKQQKNNLISNGSTITLNRRARFDYQILEEFEAGIVLTGSEVKSLREGKASIRESYIAVKDGQLQMINAHIDEYSNAGYAHHHPTRVRELLMHKREIAKLWNATQKKGQTIVPLAMYFKNSGKIKVKLALAIGKTKGDKRETIKERDWKKDKARILKNYNQ